MKEGDIFGVEIVLHDEVIDVNEPNDKGETLLNTAVALTLS